MIAKLDRGESIYGINTGFGGSADSRTANTRALQLALLQMQQCGVLPVPSSFPTGEPSSAPFALPLTDTESSLIMPEAWVRGAIVVRLSSLMRGHSGVRWEVLDKMQKLFLQNNVTPVVPVRSSISASGDLSPLSYVAGALAGQRGIYCFVTDKTGQRVRVTADEACRMHNITPVQYEPKEALGLLNGTAFSASVAGLATYEADKLATLTQLTTAMAVEALRVRMPALHPSSTRLPVPTLVRSRAQSSSVRFFRDRSSPSTSRTKSTSCSRKTTARSVRTDTRSEQLRSGSGPVSKTSKTPSDPSTLRSTAPPTTP